MSQDPVLLLFGWGNVIGGGFLALMSIMVMATESRPLYNMRKLLFWSLYCVACGVVALTVLR